LLSRRQVWLKVGAQASLAMVRSFSKKPGGSGRLKVKCMQALKYNQS
jgi:hypothetical protein